MAEGEIQYWIESGNGKWRRVDIALNACLKTRLLECDFFKTRAPRMQLPQTRTARVKMTACSTTLTPEGLGTGSRYMCVESLPSCLPFDLNIPTSRISCHHPASSTTCLGLSSKRDLQRPLKTSQTLAVRPASLHGSHRRSQPLVATLRKCQR